jgi:hydroxymethylpyrimidine pyrophosphatase-like HAD family hydrolase
MEEPEIRRVEECLERWCLDYMLHDPIPENQRFRYRSSARLNPDFRRRCEKHAAVSVAWEAGSYPTHATQFIIVEPLESGPALYERLVRELSAFNIIRSTSPLDGKSVWVEVFSTAVAKSLACAWLAEREGVMAAHVLAVGNDYNDLDLLRWAGEPHVVANAPPSLRAEFPVLPSNNEDALTHAVRSAMR